MRLLEHTVDMNVPVTTAYNHWTQFEQYPQFIESLKRVIQLDERRVYFHAELAGADQEWDAEIFEQIPDRIIAWYSVDGPSNTGSLHFIPLSANRTRVKFELNYEPEGEWTQVCETLNFLKNRVQVELQRFKDFVETHPCSVDGWRGEIHGTRVLPPGPSMGQSTGLSHSANP